ncbi:MAG: hypothetical protein COV52_08660 [Gammaproteobacteria bacterium CG11_big_fil_rev_8_21_14_0_20_46_22]|nr:MAG: hypothetical protein COW05_01130 [Gammaproteobacteria bacterium CG12_big_fil_rev_8_21_14_0_65_46_12]PIR10563.1 MAG: hypothetical protein COV52_08660 [Gammaproteobacteria bacterium CG11_big_fil_rev_8_21_14_0_20_46_22]
MSIIRRFILTATVSAMLSAGSMAAVTTDRAQSSDGKPETIQTMLLSIKEHVKKILDVNTATETLLNKQSDMSSNSLQSLSDLSADQVAYAAAKARLPQIQTQVNEAIQNNTLLTKDQKNDIYNAQQKGQMLSSQGLALILDPSTSFTLSSDDGKTAALGYSMASNPENNGIQGLTDDEATQVNQNNPKYVLYYNILQTANQNFGIYKTFLTNQLVDHIQSTSQSGATLPSVTQAESSLLNSTSGPVDLMDAISKGNIPAAMLLIGAKIISILNLIPQLVENTKMMVMFSAMTENTMNTMSLMMAKSVLTNPATLGMGTKIQPAPLSPAS